MSKGDLVRVFFDADVLIAGSASTSGASHLLLRLSEAGVIRGFTCAQARREVERNLASKLPLALPVFRALLTAAQVRVTPDPTVDPSGGLLPTVHPDDTPILMAAAVCECHYLATFNLRHYRGHGLGVSVLRPGDIVERVKRTLLNMA